MDNHILFDYNRNELLPFTYTRPVSEIRVGILTIREHYELLLDAQVSYITEKYLSEKFPNWIEEENLYFNGAVIPTPAIIDAARNLKLGQSLIQKGIPIALFAGKKFDVENSDKIEYKGTVNVIKRPWDIFTLNEVALKDQFRLITHGKKTIPLSHTNTVLGKGNVFVEEGARVECAMINAENGPVYIGRNAEIMMGAMIRGPFALCEGATVKMGAKIYGATTIGPYSKVGGEVNNSVIFGYSNKGHDGFIGNSVLGEWCNLGADSNNSNLKNNYSSVKVWDYTSNKMIDSKLQFCGLFMGDHSKCSINSMFNTGTIVGVNTNIFGHGFPPKVINSFSWGGIQTNERFSLEKAIQLAKEVYHRRNKDFDHVEEHILRDVFNLTESTDQNPL